MCAMRIRDRPVVLETPLIRTLHVDQRAGLGVDAVVNPLQPPVQPHHLVLDVAIREGIRSGSVGHGAEDDLSLVSKAAQMFVVRDVATEQIVSPGVPDQDGDPAPGDRFNVLRHGAPLAPPVVEVAVENGGLVFGNGTSLSAGSGQHSPDVPEIRVAVTARHVGDEGPEMGRCLLCSEPLTDAEQRTSYHPYVTVAPRLRGDPFDDVVAVFSELVVEIAYAFRWMRSPQPGERHSVAAPGEILKRRNEERVQHDVEAARFHHAWRSS